MPPGKLFTSWVLPLSFFLAAGIKADSSGLSAISGSIRCVDTFFAASTVGHTPMTGAGDQWMMKPSQLLPASVAPTWADFMKTTRRAGWVGDSASITSRRNGTREVR